ncbi:hypothetical protein [Exiguobacterium sp. AM39-5BH]|uniref:hypothetical protein n=1 Tax=Exiguobacterium sp. AM39-5BH TaxID=2292355 RepID=UPI000FE22B4D|nr:hypothetical protein [Exiguobacterium sp. AM39-5BH]RHB48980.1 hypothetical protein DW881_10085 [Exiguobacterium sp. AM39-5BH]
MRVLLPVLMLALIVGNLFTILGLTTSLPFGLNRLFLFGGPALTVLATVSIIGIVLHRRR